MDLPFIGKSMFGQRQAKQVMQRYTKRAVAQCFNSLGLMPSVPMDFVTSNKPSAETHLTHPMKLGPDRMMALEFLLSCGKGK